MPQGPATRSRSFEEELRDSILKNPEQGWDQFFTTYGRLIRNLIWNFRLGEEDREEVFQELCHTLVKNGSKAIRDWDPEKGALTTYLSIITVRTAIRFIESGYHKYRGRVIPEHSLDPGGWNLHSILDRTTRSAGERLHRLQVYETFKKVLSRLEQDGAISEDDRRLLTLRLGGLSYKEIEDLLGISVGTATRQFSRLKPILRRALSEAGITPATFQ
jgi:RNA polymerase sigma factor (sigma-70 family)